MTSISSRPMLPVFARMRIEPAERDARRGDAEIAPQRFADDAPDVDNALSRQVLAALCASGVWMVASATLRLGPASIITGPRRLRPRHRPWSDGR